MAVSRAVRGPGDRPVRAPPDRRLGGRRAVHAVRVVFFFIGLALFGIGLLGEYVGRIYAQVRERPRYMVEAVLEESGGESSGGPTSNGCRPWTLSQAPGSDPCGGIRLQRGRGALRARAVGAGHRRSRWCSRTPDDPGESRWFGSVNELAERHASGSRRPRIPTRSSGWPRARRARPDFVFSFYYRHMLNAAWLDMPKRGALNMHGSLLPKYRGRAPVHWAIIHGETATGASLHYMLEKPDAGALVDQQPVPILRERHRARGVAESGRGRATVLHRSLPQADRRQRRGTAARSRAGLVFRAPPPEDGRIDWRASARQIHDLVRAVAPPFPGAFTDGERDAARGVGDACRAGSAAPS